jgi:hypothetical protein
MEYSLYSEKETALIRKAYPKGDIRALDSLVRRHSWPNVRQKARKMGLYFPVEQVEPFSQLSIDDRNYFAGLTDAEGSLSIHYIRKRRTYRAMVQIAMTELQSVAIRELRVKIGGCLSPRKGKGNRRNSLNWACVGIQAARFLQTILPHMRIKTRQAEIILEFQRFRNSVRYEHKMSDDTRTKYEALFQEIAILNRGKGPGRRVN